jgi:hypothetical protein
MIQDIFYIEGGSVYAIRDVKFCSNAQDRRSWCHCDRAEVDRIMSLSSFFVVFA